MTTLNKNWKRYKETRSHIDLDKVIEELIKLVGERK